MSGRAGYRRVTARRPCPVCEKTSHCLVTDESFRLQISRGGVMHQVEAPGTVLCMKGLGDVPGWHRHGQAGKSGGVHYVPASVWAAITGGEVTGEAIDAEKAAWLQRKRAEAEREARMQSRKLAGRIWNMARTRAEESAKGRFPYRAEHEFSREDLYPHAAAYLGARLSRPVKLCRSIRSIWALEYFEEDQRGEAVKIGSFPALLAAATDPAGKVCGLQRIYLAPDDNVKLPGHEAKKWIGDLCRGAAVRIGTEEAFGMRPEGGVWVEGAGPETLILCEGVETGYACWEVTGLPVMALISTSGLMNVVLPARWTDAQLGGLKRIIIAADHDRFSDKTRSRAGITYARLAAAKLREAHGDRVSVEITLPRFELCPELVGRAPGASDEFGDVLLGARDGKEGKTVDWLDVFVRYGPDVAWKGITNGTGEERTGARADSAGRESARIGGDDRFVPVRGASPTGEAPGGHGGGDAGGVDGQRAAGDLRTGGEEKRWGDGGGWERGGRGGGEGGKGAGGGEGDGGGEGVAGGDPAADGGKRPPLLPGGELAQAREFLKHNAAIGASAAARAGQRWELCYMHEGESWYEYNGTCWEKIPESLLVARLQNFFEPYWKVKEKKNKGDRVFIHPDDGREVAIKRAALSTKACAGILNAMKGDCGIYSPGGALPAWSAPTFDGAGFPIVGAGLKRISQQAQTKVVPVKNGLLRLDALLEGRVVLEPHTTRYISTACAPFDLPVELMQQQMERDPGDEEAGGKLCHELCPSFQKVLAAAAGDCDIYAREFMKYVGLCYTDDTSFETILYQTGRPGTGKGTLFEGVTAAIGEANVYMSSANQICGKHEIVNYIGKNIIGFDEFEAGHSTDSVEASRRLKTTGVGTATSVEAKFDDAYTTRITGKFWLISNKLAKLKDSSAAMARRLLIFPMAIGTPSPEKRDPNLKRQVKAEARGIMVWALFHLRILYRHGRFYQPPAGLAQLENFKRLVSPVHAFVQDCLVSQAGSACEESLLRDLYVAYAMNAGVGRLGQENLYSELESAVDVLIERYREPDGTKMVRGIRPRVEDEKRAPLTMYNHPADIGRLGAFDFAFPMGGDGIVGGGGGGDGGSGGGGGSRQSDIPF